MIHLHMLVLQKIQILDLVDDQAIDIQAVDYHNYHKHI